MSAAAPEIAVVIPTYNRSARILPLLESLAAQTLPPQSFEVIVVDDCSTDDTHEVVEKAAANLPYRLRVLRTPRNHGPAAARNLGWQSATAPFVAFTDDDCDPSAQWLSAGLRALRSAEAPGVVQGSTHIPEGTPVDQLLDWNVHRYVAGPTPWYEGCNLFFRHDVLAQTGGFDEDIRYYGEDCAAGWRVTEAGYRRAFEPDAAVTHAVE
ncbi:MAG TPA: glycosyltransferase, partial [Acidimicrobiales bacterium]